MTTTKIPPLDKEFNIDELPTIHRRHAERRGISRRSSRLQLLTHDDIRRLRRLNTVNADKPRIDKRRKQERRSSRPKILSTQEIARLRRNQL